LGLLEEFLKRPHQQVRQLHGVIGDTELIVADFSYLKVSCPFVAFMPQWDFLNFLVEHAEQYPTFRLLMQTEAIGLIDENGGIAGVRAQTPGGPIEIRAPLTIGADGRQSTVRKSAGLRVRDLGAPIDVLWMRLSRRREDPDQPLGRFDRGRILVLLYRGDYWQCGFVIPKLGYEEVRRQGLPAFRRQVAETAPFLADRVDELTTWDDIKLLTVKVDRLDIWYRTGLLCIGDAAHAMSPVGGVGINLAIQDAVAAANILCCQLKNNSATTNDLRQVQKRRELPTQLTQALQVFIQNRVINRVLTTSGMLAPPWPLRLLRRWPMLRRIPARVIGIGFRPEHVRTPDAFKADSKYPEGGRT
jgi:2-polyprenyl-6-methoxyphenol hydroxylase-like FAD-dependent oxidoreductase